MFELLSAYAAFSASYALLILAALLLIGVALLLGPVARTSHVLQGLVVGLGSLFAVITVVITTLALTLALSGYLSLPLYEPASHDMNIPPPPQSGDLLFDGESSLTWY